MQDDVRGDINETELEDLWDALLQSTEAQQKMCMVALLNLSEDSFCCIITRLLPESQAHRRTCAALRTLCLRLQSLTAPASNTLLGCVILAGELLHHFLSYQCSMLHSHKCI